MTLLGKVKDYCGLHSSFLMAIEVPLKMPKWRQQPFLSVCFSVYDILSCICSVAFLTSIAYYIMSHDSDCHYLCDYTLYVYLLFQSVLFVCPQCMSYQFHWMLLDSNMTKPPFLSPITTLLIIFHPCLVLSYTIMAYPTLQNVIS